MAQENNINTYDKEFKIKHYVVDGVKMNEVKGDLAEQVRSCEVQEIKVYF
mgnify:FL=1